MSERKAVEKGEQLGRVLYKEIEKLWEIVEKNALKVERLDDDILALLVTALNPVCLVRSNRELTIEEKEEGRPTHVYHYTYVYEVSIAKLNDRLHVFIFNKSREAAWEPVQRERYIALVDIENREFKRKFINWLLSLPLPQVKIDRVVGRKVISLADEKEQGIQVFTVRRTPTKLVIHTLNLPSGEENLKTYSLI